MDPNLIPKGTSPESTPDGLTKPTGVYKHPVTGHRLVASSAPHADAFTRQGFKYEGPYDPKNPPATQPTPAELKAARATRSQATSTESDLKKQLDEANARAESEAAARAEAEKKLADAAKGNGGNN